MLFVPTYSVWAAAIKLYPQLTEFFPLINFNLGDINWHEWPKLEKMPVVQDWIFSIYNVFGYDMNSEYDKYISYDKNGDKAFNCAQLFLRG